MAKTAGFGQVLRQREARTLLVAALLSGLGDQVARIALSVLVLHRSGSVLLTACVYAVSYLPWVLGGPVLAALADRLPSRRVLVGSDLWRAVTIGLMLVPGIPLWGLLLLLLLTELAAPPFDATRAGVLPEMLEGDSYVTGCALLTAVQQTCLFGGVAFGGLLLVLVDPMTALALDAATFLGSAALVQRGLRARPAPAGPERLSLRADTVVGLHAVFNDAPVRRMVLGAWVACAVAVLPEGLAVAYATQLGAETYAVPVLLAAGPLGSMLAALGLARLVSPDRRPSLMWPLMAFSCLPLLGMLAAPGLLGSAVLLFLSGCGSAAVLLVSTTVGRTVDAAVRGRVFGIAASGLMAAQGAALLAGGVLASFLPIPLVIAVAGVGGLLVIVPLAVRAAAAQRQGADAVVVLPAAPAVSADEPAYA